MKKEKRKKFFLFKSFAIFTIIFFCATIVHGIDTIGEYIKLSKSTGLGSNKSQITFSKKITSYYINKDSDSEIIGDYLKGYYFDSMYGYFRLDWSNDKTKNVRFIGKSSKCNSGNGYKLGGFAYSKYLGYIKFNYDSNNYVYYCENEEKLYGHAYSKHLGFQVLDGIGFKISKIYKSDHKIDDNDGFTNDSGKINTDKESNGWTEKNIGGGDRYEIENAKIIEGSGSIKKHESIFWIVK